jgi:hypothetical protein
MISRYNILRDNLTETLKKVNKVAISEEIIESYEDLRTYSTLYLFYIDPLSHLQRKRVFIDAFKFNNKYEEESNYIEKILNSLKNWDILGNHLYLSG